MTERLRLAGRGRLPDGNVVMWSVAEGGRGRRWRWAHRDQAGTLRVSGLVELGPDGRFSRLELVTSGGLLTFHPVEDGRSAHGNVVTADAVLPMATTWRPEWGVGIVGDPFGSAIARWRRDGLVVTWHHGELVWREPGRHPDVDASPLDDRGVPHLDDAKEWPLEAD
jgi:hypothetical protein